MKEKAKQDDSGYFEVPAPGGGTYSVFGSDDPEQLDAHIKKLIERSERAKAERANQVSNDDGTALAPDGLRVFWGAVLIAAEEVFWPVQPGQLDRLISIFRGQASRSFGRDEAKADKFVGECINHSLDCLAKDDHAHAEP